MSKKEVDKLAQEIEECCEGKRECASNGLHYMYLDDWEALGEEGQKAELERLGISIDENAANILHNSYKSKIVATHLNGAKTVDDVLNEVGKEKIKTDIYKGNISIEELAYYFAFDAVEVCDTPLMVYLDVMDSMMDGNYFFEVCDSLYDIYYRNGGEEFNTGGEVIDLTEQARNKTIEEFAQFCVSFDFRHFDIHIPYCRDYEDWLIKAYESVIMWFLFM